jgi:ceroid-lipofuscinosis MFS transporter 7
MGLMTGSGCMSRVLGPVFVGIIYTRYGTIWTFGITSLMMIFPMIWLYVLRSRLLIPEFDGKSVEMAELKVEANGHSQPKLINANDLKVEENKDGESATFFNIS